jgi:poly(3-hydroxybutyrate) depolymerase
MYFNRLHRTLLMMSLFLCYLIACDSNHNSTSSADTADSSDPSTNTSETDTADTGDSSNTSTSASENNSDANNQESTQGLEQNGRVQLDVNGQSREYKLYIPSTQSETDQPLLIVVHGGGGRDYPFPQQNRFQQLAEQEGFVIAYALSELQPGNEGEWQLNTDNQSLHDINYIEAIMDDVAQRTSIDATRVYATGYSIGSMFVYELVCQLSSRLAAVASYAGTMPMNPKSCTPSDYIGVMHLHGSDDWLISYTNSWDWKEWDSVGTMLDIPSLVGYWKSKYNCQNETQQESSSSLHTIHDQCDQNARVEHHSVNGVEHEWPDEINNVSTHQVIWTFLSGFSKR